MSTERRIKAARALAGLSVERLADRLAEMGEEGLGARTLSKIEAGTRPVRPRELGAIARACGVCDEFLLGMDFSRRVDGMSEAAA